MLLKEYFIKSGIHPEDFAHMLKISSSSVYRYMAGGKPHPLRAYEISNATNKEVSVNELLGLPDGKYP